MEDKSYKINSVSVSILVVLLILISCGEKEKIVEVPVEVGCYPEAPRDVEAVNHSDCVSIYWWHPNPDGDVTRFKVYRSDSLLVGYYPIATVYVADYPHETYAFYYDDFDTQYRRQYYYAVTAINSSELESELSYEGVSGTPRPEQFIKLYDNEYLPDSSGYCFATLDNITQWDTLPTTDIYYTTSSGIPELVVPHPTVRIQDYGYVPDFEFINRAPECGWSGSGRAEAIEEHCYIIRLSESTGFHYAKLFIETIDENSVGFRCAYQLGPDNRDLAPPPPGEGGVKEAARPPVSVVYGTGGKVKKSFEIGRQSPPSFREGSMETNNGM